MTDDDDNLIALQHCHQRVRQVQHAEIAIGWLLVLAACLLTLPKLFQILLIQMLVNAILCHDK